MEHKIVSETVEEVVKTTSGKLGKKALIVGGALAGLLLGSLWLSKRNASIEELEESDDFEEEDEEENDEGSEEE